jgi:predicted ester cyclase
MQGTHLGPLDNLQPTGRSIDVLQINIERFENGRIVEIGGSGTSWHS